MGRRQRRGPPKGGASTGGDDRAPQGGRYSSRCSFDKPETLTNEKFLQFYQQQGVVDPAEWDALLAAFRTPLPSAWRLNPMSPLLETLRAQLKDLAAAIPSDKPQATPISWFPEALAWHIPLARGLLRKEPDIKPLHQWLVQNTAIGAVSRQEIVSMIPPLILAPEPHHAVLDMCASPGSKTVQLLEMLHAGAAKAAGTDVLDGGCIPRGVVVANELDTKRAYMLVFQSKRVSSPALLVTTHDGRQFPNPGVGGRHDAAPVFDRVLADVPCSGDGTLRKAPDAWAKWSPAAGIGLHTLQIEIARRGLQLLKPDGYMVYSTCSLNPMENESVVAELLREFGGDVEVVDTSDRLPGLKRRPGMQHWKVLDNLLQEYTSIEEVQLARAHTKLAGMKAKLEAQEAGGDDAAGEPVKRPRMDGDAAAAAAATTATSEADTPAAGADKYPPLPEQIEKQEALIAELQAKVGHDVAPAVRASHTHNIRASHFPPKPEEARVLEQLPRCMRLLPHDSNTGGFFVCLLHKKATAKFPEHSVDAGVKEMSVTELADKHTQIQAPASSALRQFLKDSWGVGDSVMNAPDGSPALWMNVGGSRNISLASEGVANLLSAPAAWRMHVVNAGNSALEAQYVLAPEGATEYAPPEGSRALPDTMSVFDSATWPTNTVRITNCGLPYFIRSATKRIATVPFDEFLKVVLHAGVSVGWDKFHAELAEALPQTNGSSMLVGIPSWPTRDAPKPADLTLPLSYAAAPWASTWCAPVWTSAKAITCMLRKEERDSMADLAVEQGLVAQELRTEMEAGAEVLRQAKMEREKALHEKEKAAAAAAAAAAPAEAEANDAADATAE